MKYAPLFLLWLCIMSLISMLAMGIDKLKARRGARRIPEKVLFLTAALGGSLGAILAMAAFRHKTRHLSFVFGLPLILLLQLILALYVTRA